MTRRAHRPDHPDPATLGGKATQSLEQKLAAGLVHGAEADEERISGFSAEAAVSAAFAAMVFSAFADSANYSASQKFHAEPISQKSVKNPKLE